MSDPAIEAFGRLMRGMKRTGADFDLAFESAFERTHWDHDTAQRRAAQTAVRETRPAWRAAYCDEPFALPGIARLVGLLTTEDEPPPPRLRIVTAPSEDRRDVALELLRRQASHTRDVTERLRAARAAGERAEVLRLARRREREREMALMKRSYLCGATLREIGEALGTDGMAVMRRFRRAGFQTRGPGSPPGAKLGEKYAVRKASGGDAA
jgi:hypothetical protein